MSDNELRQRITQAISVGVTDSITLGHLSPERFGYCFMCEKETGVHDVAPEFPVQPPMCFSCLVQRGVDLAMNPDSRLGTMLRDAHS